MDINSIFSKALDKLKSKFTLPTEGFLAGGSIANLIWEEVSGKEALINDIDIFILKNLDINLERNNTYDKFTTKTINKYVFEDYSGINFGYRTEIKYWIDEAIRDGIYNNIYYTSNTKSPQIIIDSFDLNCCQVGYDLVEQKFYFTKEFIEFLETGEIKIIDLRTPAHTAIRLAKKQMDLGAKVNNVEFEILKYALKHKNLMGVQKYRFKEKYKNEFYNYYELLSEKFTIGRDLEAEKSIKSLYNSDDKIYSLQPIGEVIDINSNVYAYLPKTFIYWYRNIQGNDKLKSIWINLNLIIDNDLNIEEYLDSDISDDEINLLSRLIHNAPQIINNIKGYPISKQIEWTKKIIEKFESDPIIAISVLESTPLDMELDLNDEMNLLLLELSVRKKILSDPRNKVGRILKEGNVVETKSANYCYIEDLTT